MGTITLERIHEDIIGLKKEMEKLRLIVAENYELSNDVVEDIKASRKNKDLVSQEEMRKEFG